MAFCDVLSTDVKVTFCQIPRAVLGIDIIAWFDPEGEKITCRLLFCITLCWYVMSILRSRGQGPMSIAQDNEEHKEEPAPTATELDEMGNAKTSV
jgi:hypothetical protein